MLTDPSHEYLVSILDYNPSTGEFTWSSPRPKIKVGQRAGTTNHKDGYVRIKIDGRQFLAHRLVWFYVHGVWPVEFIDHINGEKADNRLVNLREATRSQNGQNKRNKARHSKSTLLGATWSASNGAWQAQIRVPGRTSRHIGYFTTEQEAHDAYVAEKRLVHEYGEL